MYTISDVRNAVARHLHGTTANQITDFYGVCYDAACAIQGKVDAEETRRTVQLASLLYPVAYQVACPSDLKGVAVIDIRPTGTRDRSDVPVQVRSQDFDRMKAAVMNGTLFEVHHDTGVKTLNVAIPKRNVLLVCDCATPVSNGLWQAVSGVASLGSSAVYKIAFGSALQVVTDGSGDAVYENATLQSIDLFLYEAQGVVFQWKYCQPGLALPTSYGLRWGSSPTDYWSNSATAQWDGTAFREGWNLVGFEFVGAAVTGTPDSSKITYLRETVGLAPGPATTFYVGPAYASLGAVYDLEYYSKFLFRDSTGAFKDRPTSNTDVLNLDTDSYPLFVNRLGMLCAQQQQGKDSASDLAFFAAEYKEAEEAYYRKYPSQSQKAQSSYYRVKRGGQSRNFGRAALRG